MIMNTVRRGKKRYIRQTNRQTDLDKHMHYADKQRESEINRETGCDGHITRNGRTELETDAER